MPHHQLPSPNFLLTALLSTLSFTFFTFLIDSDQKNPWAFYCRDEKIYCIGCIDFISRIYWRHFSVKEELPVADDYQISCSNDDIFDDASTSRRSVSFKSVYQSAPSNGSSSLPSAFNTFFEDHRSFFNNCVEEKANVRDVEHQLGRHGR